MGSPSHPATRCPTDKGNLASLDASPYTVPRGHRPLRRPKPSPNLERNPLPPGGWIHTPSRGFWHLRPFRVTKPGTVELPFQEATIPLLPSPLDKGDHQPCGSLAHLIDGRCIRHKGEYSFSYNKSAHTHDPLLLNFVYLFLKDSPSQPLTISHKKTTKF